MIDTLTLHGFKSFAQRTTLEFGAGITAVIGPNGSGKSNVVEALRWVTHQARARELRAGRATELIFHGGQSNGGQSRSGGKGKNAPLGLAEVQAEIRSDRERLSLSRRIYRDGSSEQELGGRAVRVRDVQAALRGTGLGVGGLAVIGQGEVSGVVEAPPTRLLGYLQEAAGLSAAVAARLETERGLAAARSNLEDLALVQRERAANLEHLRAAAADAVQARAWQTRIAALEAAGFYARQLSLRAELAAARRGIAEAEAASRALAQQVSHAAEASEAAREALAQARSEAAAHSEALGALRAAEQALDQAGRYRQHLRAEGARLRDELAGLPTAAPAQPAPDLADLAAKVQRAGAKAEALETQAQALEAQQRQAHTEQQRRAEEGAKAEARAEALGREVQRIKAALDELKLDGSDTGGTEMAEAGQPSNPNQPSSPNQPSNPSQPSNLSELEQRVKALEHQQAEAKAAQQALGMQRAEVQAGLAPLEREQARLEAALNSYARYGEGARNALRLDHAGIVGSVADLLEVPAKLETAVTAALGRRLEQVVVQTADDARDIIGVLKRQGGRATFLPLELLRAPRRQGDHLLGGAGVVGNLADLCPTDPPPVGQSLLSGTLVVETLEVANQIARSNARRPRLVTLGGEVVEPSGAMTGGRLRDTGGAVLADTRRFHELGEEIAALRARLTELDAAATREAPDLSAELQAAKAAYAEAHAGHIRREALGRERHARRQALQAELQRVTAQWEAAQQQLQTAAELPAHVPDWETLETQMAALRQQAQQARAAEREAAEAHALGRELSAQWKAYTAAQARAEALQQRTAAHATAETEQEGHLQSAEAEVARRRAALGDFDPEALARAEAATKAKAETYAGLIAQQNKARARLDDLRLTAARREAALEPVPDGCAPAGTPREWAHEAGKLRRQLGELGPVNARAEADFQAAQLEYDTLQAQIADAEAAADELHRHLAAQASAEAKATRAALDTVSAAFAGYAHELLGGNGELNAETDAEGHVTGLTLAVQPGGKRTRSLTLLSTGERTMAGLAFLFALNHAGAEGGAGGLPLAVLDEVDAPLDEANIRRFTAFLTRFAAQGTQFVLVTHQKATMEVADALWGVTTGGDGISRVLSIRQGEAG